MEAMEAMETIEIFSLLEQIGMGKALNNGTITIQNCRKITRSYWEMLSLRLTGDAAAGIYMYKYLHESKYRNAFIQRFNSARGNQNFEAKNEEFKRRVNLQRIKY
jgi:hypothetical protein